MFPDFVKPYPPSTSICPAPENWANVIVVVPKVTAALLVNTNPLFAFVAPTSMNVYAPGPISVSSLKSVARVRTIVAPDVPSVVTL